MLIWLAVLIPERAFAGNQKSNLRMQLQLCDLNRKSDNGTLEADKVRCKVPRIFGKVKFLPSLLLVSLVVFCPGLVHAVDKSIISPQGSGEITEPAVAANDDVWKDEMTQAADATRKWVLDRLREALSHPADLSQIASMLYALVNDTSAAEHPHTRHTVTELDTFVRAIDVQTLDCGNLVSLRFIANFLGMAGFIGLDTAGLDRRLYDCLDDMNSFDKVCALFSLCRFPSGSAPREELLRAVKSIEALQQADGSFGPYHGLQRYYLTTHAVFALHACNATPNVVRRGQSYLLSELPGLRQAGFLDGLLESLIMLRKMGVAIANERHYTDYLRARVRRDGSICFFDRPGCRSNVPATGLLLEFLREFGD